MSGRVLAALSESRSDASALARHGGPCLPLCRAVEPVRDGFDATAQLGRFQHGELDVEDAQVHRDVVERVRPVVRTHWSGPIASRAPVLGGKCCAASSALACSRTLAWWGYCAVVTAAATSPAASGGSRGMKRYADLQKRTSPTSGTALGGRCEIKLTLTGMTRPPCTASQPEPDQRTPSHDRRLLACC
jgi:hypothetical protein